MFLLSKYIFVAFTLTNVFTVLNKCLLLLLLFSLCWCWWLLPTVAECWWWLLMTATPNCCRMLMMTVNDSNSQLLLNADDDCWWQQHPTAAVNCYSLIMTVAVDFFWLLFTSADCCQSSFKDRRLKWKKDYRNIKGDHFYSSRYNMKLTRG